MLFKMIPMNMSAKTLLRGVCPTQVGVQSIPKGAYQIYKAVILQVILFCKEILILIILVKI